MDYIRVNTEQTREAGRRLLTEGDRLAEIGRELQQAIGSLDTWAWDGASRWRAEPLLARVRPQSAAAADGLDGLGRKLLRVADVFETEDATAAQNLVGMPWVNWDTAAGAGAVVAGAGGALAPGFGVWEANEWMAERTEFDGAEKELRLALVEGSVWEKEGVGSTRLGGVRLGGKAEADALHGEAGVGINFEDGEMIAGAFAAGTLFTAGASGVIGSTDLGLAGGVEATVGKAEAFVGLKDGRVGAKIGGTLASVEGTVGANVAGWNVGLTGEVGLKFELGLEVGKKTKVYLGPFTVGLSIGEALGS